MKKKSVKKSSLIQEKRLSKEMNFKRQIMSGALEGVTNKEDGFDPEFIYQLKETSKKSINISLKILDTLTKNAFIQDKDPIMIITFNLAKNPIPKDWVLITKETWLGILKCQNGNQY